MAGVTIPTVNTGLLYDTVVYASGDSKQTFFSNTSSGSGNEITNLRKASQINSDSFVVKGLEIQFQWGATQQDINDIFRRTYVQFQIDGNPVFTLPTRVLSCRVSIQGVDNRGTGAGQVSLQPYSGGRVFGLKETVSLLQKMAIAADIKKDKQTAPQLVSSTDITLALHGTEGQEKYVQ